jgi:hypothetical protein
MGSRIATPDTLTRPMSERQLHDCVVQAARLFGWMVQWTHDSRHSPAGWPDLVLCRGPRLLAVELKRDGKKLTPAQVEWSAALTVVSIASGGVVSWHLWTTKHWHDGTIESVLRGG